VLDALVRSPELEDVLLQAWLGRPPDEAVRARLELVRAQHVCGGILGD
jgi:hypothetical protein